MVGEVSPQVGADHAHDLAERYQQTDLEGIQAARLKVERHVWREQSRQAEVSRKERAEPPVRRLRQGVPQHQDDEERAASGAMP